MKNIDYSGVEFNKIKVIERIGTTQIGKKKRSLWLCQCECGNYLELSSDKIQSKKQKSCGCVRKRGCTKRLACKYEFYGKKVVGIDRKGEKFIFDIEDYEKIKGYSWHVNKDGQVKTCIGRKTISLHRYIMNLFDSNYEVDHINHDRTDNRKENLRVVTHTENMRNVITPKNNTSGRVGVQYLPKKNKWKARIHIGDKYIEKTFDTFEEAVEKRIELEKEYFGEMRNKNL